MRVVLAGMTVAVTMAAAVIRLPAQDARLVDIPIGLDLYVPAPEDNAITPEKIALGRRLFFDRRLSGDSKTACVTCHQPARAFTDGRRLPRGAFGRPGRRNAPSLFNRAYGETFFWDGRAATLEDQALAALAGDTDLALSGDKASTRLATDATYVAEFQAAFGGGPSADRMAQALATFVRAQLAGSSAVDRFVEGDLQALSLAARRGRDLFSGKARCDRCHSGPLFADEAFHNTGVGWRGDRGRVEVTSRPEDRGRFKTPSLRNVALTAPYMHDGSFATLEAVIKFYDRGGRPNPNLDQDVRPLGLTPAERRDLGAFLRALTSETSR